MGTEDRQMMSVREIPWHNEARILTEWPDSFEQAWVEACKGADGTGVPWDVVEKPIYDENGQPIEGFKRYARTDNDATLIATRDSWTAIRNDEFGAILESFFRTKDTNVKIDTLGALDGGRRIFSTVILGQDFHIGKDPSAIRRYGFLTNAHDGTASCKFGSTNVRIVCANTQKAAEGDAKGSGYLYSFRHTKKWKQNIDQILDQVAEALGKAREDAHKFKTFGDSLVDMEVSDKGIEQFVDRFLVLPDNASDRKRMAIEGQRVSLRSVFSDEYQQDMNTLTGIKNTAWGLYQAGIEWLDYRRPTKDTDDDRILIDKTLFGVNEMKVRASVIAREIAKEFPASAPKPARKPAPRKAAAK